VILVSTETYPDAPIRLGAILTATAVSGANVLRDMREAITNTLGGKMTRYEAVIDQTLERALEILSAKAAERGYDGVLAIRFTHPVITDGAIEVVATGTGFHLAQTHTPDRPWG
jgi:uncharacterized protein YbjQ (UPF0145 family)